jgi:hypothetical protein
MLATAGLEPATTCRLKAAGNAYQGRQAANAQDAGFEVVEAATR